MISDHGAKRLCGMLEILRGTDPARSAAWSSPLQSPITSKRSRESPGRVVAEGKHRHTVNRESPLRPARFVTKKLRLQPFASSQPGGPG